MDDRYFHATHIDWLDHILQHGLKPSGPPGAVPKILLFRREADARALAASVFDVQPHEACIITVDGFGLDISLPEQSETVLGQHIFATCAIPPQRLTRV
jgi:hypothetical protein